MTTSKPNDGGSRIWYPFHPSGRILFRGIGAVYVVGVVLTFFMEGRFSVLGCLLAAMFFAWDSELAPKNLRNRIGIVLHWFIGLFFLGLASISIWLLFFPISTQ